MSTTATIILREENMAIWQWDVWIVPRKEVVERLSVIPEYMDQDWFETNEWWNTASETELVGFFDSLLPTYDTLWAKNTQSWGSDDGDRVELMTEDGKITDVVIRVDLRDLNINFLASLMIFSAASEYVFYSLESKKFIEPDLSELLNEIRNSRKMVFIRDPEKFFEDKNYLEKINIENRRKLDNDR